MRRFLMIDKLKFSHGHITPYSSKHATQCAQSYCWERCSLKARKPWKVSFTISWSLSDVLKSLIFQFINFIMVRQRCEQRREGSEQHVQYIPLNRHSLVHCNSLLSCILMSLLSLWGCDVCLCVYVCVSFATLLHEKVKLCRVRREEKPNQTQLLNGDRVGDIRCKKNNANCNRWR